MTGFCIRAAGIVVLALLLAAGAVAQRAAVTLDAILSAPFSTGLTAAPGGAAIAWVTNVRGARNIWVAEAPDYHARQLTSYSGDTGQEVGGLEWTPDGAAIVYVLGGSRNRQGEHPNPSSLPDPVEQAIWIVRLDGGEPVRIGQGSGPAVSPRGDRVAFVERGQAWSAPIDGSGEAEPLFSARGQAGSLRWSPDGSMLAFVSSRSTHAYVGIFDVERREVRFPDASVDRDSDPAWSPDGRRLAFRRTPASREIVAFAPRREAEPWSIRVVDVGTGRAHEAWKAASGMGSAFQAVSASNQILWGDGDRLVFPWEDDGWLSLYSVPAAGGVPERLTPPGAEVEHVALDSARRDVLYSSNHGDIDRRHIWRVPVAGAAPAAVTTGSGIEWSPVAIAGDRGAAFLRSDARVPARPALRLGEGPVRDLMPDAVPASFPDGALVEPEAVVFPAADGMSIRGQLFAPPDLRPGDRRPAVLFLHGGSRRQMLLGWHYLDYYHRTYALNQYLALRGFLVLSVNFRSGTGYGMEFREAIDYGATGASEFNDVLGAGLFMRARTDVDPDRIGLWGGSYGGYLTALGLARASDLFAAGVDVHGVHDWNVVIRNFVPAWDPLERPEAARLAFESSPMAHLDGWRSPVLVIHGDDDRNVPFSETVDLVAELRRRGVELEQLVFPDEVHGFLRHDRWLEVLDAAAEFLERKLAR